MGIMNSTQQALVVHIETKVTPPFETADQTESERTRG